MNNEHFDNIVFQIIKLSIEEGGKFYFYNDVENFDNEPHAYNISYEEDVCVMDEIYSRQIFMTPFLRCVYSRVVFINS